MQVAGVKSFSHTFNGKQDNPAWSADAVVQDYGFRLYSTGIGRFLSVDPLASSYPMLTPYQFASNSPIANVDLDGLEAEAAIAFMKELIWGHESLEVVTADDGFHELQKQTYSLQVRSNRDDFERLKSAYSTDPGIIHNPDNPYATYYPIENPNDSDNVLAKGDYMYIDIAGPINDYVLLDQVQFDDNSFLIRALTLEGHTDAGYIEFSAKYVEESGIIEFSIHNETRINIGVDIIEAGRIFQMKQWNLVVDNVEGFLGGQTLSKRVDIISPRENVPVPTDLMFSEDRMSGESDLWLEHGEGESRVDTRDFRN